MSLFIYQCIAHRFIAHIFLHRLQGKWIQNLANWRYRQINPASPTSTFVRIPRHALTNLTKDLATSAHHRCLANHCWQAMCQNDPQTTVSNQGSPRSLPLLLTSNRTRKRAVPPPSHTTYISTRSQSSSCMDFGATSPLAACSVQIVTRLLLPRKAQSTPIFRQRRTEIVGTNSAWLFAQS
jgi:hypothetical protein